MFNSALAFTERLLPPLLPFFPSLFLLFSFERQSCSYFFSSSSFPVREGRHLRLRGESGSYRWLPFLFFLHMCVAFLAHFLRALAHSHTLAQTSKMCARAWPQTPHYCRGQLCAARRSAHACSAFGTGEVAVLISLFGGEPTIVAAPLAKSTTLTPLLTITASYFPEL